MIKPTTEFDVPYGLVKYNQTGVVTIPTGTSPITIVPCSIKEYQIGNDIVSRNADSSIFTAMYNAVYRFYGYCYFNNGGAAGRRTVSFVINNASANVPATSTVTTTISTVQLGVTLVRPMSVGDTISLGLWQDSGIEMTTSAAAGKTGIAIELVQLI